jgi:hypothetical protein
LALLSAFLDCTASATNEQRHTHTALPPVQPGLVCVQRVVLLGRWSALSAADAGTWSGLFVAHVQHKDVHGPVCTPADALTGCRVRSALCSQQVQLQECCGFLAAQSAVSATPACCTEHSTWVHSCVSAAAVGLAGQPILAGVQQRFGCCCFSISHCCHRHLSTTQHRRLSNEAAALSCTSTVFSMG